MHLAQVVDGDTGVELRRFQTGMPQHLLQLPDRCPVAQHVRRAGMT